MNNTAYEDGGVGINEPTMFHNPSTDSYNWCLGYVSGRVSVHQYWHRVGHPAHISKDGYTSWYIKNNNYVITELYCNACGFDDKTTDIWSKRYGELLPIKFDQVYFISAHG